MTSQMIEWTSDLSVGIPQLDDDHKKLIDLLNQIFVASYAGVGDQLVMKVVKELIDYTHYHFQREEDLLVKNHYPACSTHKEEHQKLIAELMSIKENIPTDLSDGLSTELTLFLRHWLIDHIKTHDLKYAEFIKELGVAI